MHDERCISRSATEYANHAGCARHAGGDWCEAFVISKDVVALSIGDVCGHGAEKAAAMIALRQAIRDAAWLGLDPAQILAVANVFLHGYDPEENATAVFALFDNTRRSLTFANAGHPPPLIAGPFGALFLEYTHADVPLGIAADIAPALHVVNVPAATLVVLYTDGVSERERNPLQGEVQLLDAAMCAYRGSHSLSASVIEMQMLLSGSNFDDAAILTAWIPGVPIMRGRTTRRSHLRGVPSGETG